MRSVTAVACLVVVQGSGIAGPQRGSYPSCKDFVRLTSIDQRISNLFANRAYYEAKCRKEINVASEVERLFEALSGARSGEIRQRTAVLFGTAFEARAKESYLGALYAETQQKDKSTAWVEQQSTFAGSRFEQPAQKSYLSALMRELEAGGNSQSWKTNLPRFRGSELETEALNNYSETLLRELNRSQDLDAWTANLGEFADPSARERAEQSRMALAARVAQESRDSDQVRRACRILLTSSNERIASASAVCEQRAKDLDLERKFSGMIGTADLEHWLDVQQDFFGTSYQSRVDTEIERRLLSSTDLDQVIAACLKIYSKSLKSRCQEKAREIALHFVHTDPSDRNLQRAGTVCRDAPCALEIEAYEFGIRITAEVQRMADTQDARVPVELLESVAFWTALDAGLHETAKKRYRHSLEELAPTLGPVIQTKIARCMERAATTAEKGESDWKDAQQAIKSMWFWQKEAKVRRVDGSLRVTYAAYRQDPNNARARQLIDEMIRFRNEITGKVGEIQLQLKAVFLLAQNVFSQLGPVWVRIVVPVIIGLAGAEEPPQGSAVVSSLPQTM